MDEIASNIILTPTLLTQYLQEHLAIKVAVEDVATYDNVDLRINVTLLLDGQVVAQGSDTYHGLADGFHRHDREDF